MTIDEAIKRLQSRLSGYPFEGASRNMDDLKLGMEALKRVKWAQSNDLRLGAEDLPGQTEE